MGDGALDFIPDQTNGRLGRHIHHDPDNRAYPVRGVLFAEDAPLRSKTWWRRGIFDQGHTSSCTAQAAAGVLKTSPFRIVLDRANLTSYDEDSERIGLYYEAQLNDPWPGEEPSYYGSSTDAPFKVFRNRGQIREWRWAFGVDDVLRTLAHHGPVAIGINWKDDMFDTDSRGFINYTGEIRGGHAVQLLGLRIPTSGDVEKGYVVGINSWGPWGYNNTGRFKFRIPQLRQALEDQGEAVTIVV